jgi:hypothetical protein
MRSRPQVKLWHGGDIVPGAMLPVTFELRFSDETPVDLMTVKLAGYEFAGTGSGKTRYVANKQTVSQVRELPGKTFAPGTYKYDVSFAVPADVPPSHQGYDAHVRYELFLHVSIPWWPDRRVTYAIPVVFPRTPPYPPDPRVFSNRTSGSGEDYPVIELSVDTTDIAQNETLRGQVAVSDLGARTCRGVDVALVEMEDLREPRVTSRIANRWARRIFHGRPPEGETIPFSVRLPPNAHPSFTGALYGVRTFLEISCDIQLGSDVTMRAPLIVRPELSAPREKSPDLIQPVGNGRLDRVFAVVAGRLQLHHEPGQRTLQGRAGDVDFAVSLVHKQDGYYRVAKYKYPPLGVDFMIEEKGLDNLFGLKTHAVEALPGYAVTARDTDQVHALCDCIGKRAGYFSHMSFNDSAGEVWQKGDASTVESLSSFTLRAVDFANALAETIANIPAPRGMGEHAIAWQAYAERVGGTFRRPAMRIDRGRIGFDVLSIVTHYAVHGVPTDTTLELVMDPPVPRPEEVAQPDGRIDLDSPAISPEARRLGAELRKDRAAVVRFDRVIVSIPGSVADPATHATVVDHMAALANALRARGAQLPYR